VQHFTAPGLPRKADALRRLEVAHVRRIVAHIEGRAGAGKVAGSRGIRASARGIARHRDVRRQRSREACLVRHDAAEAGIFERRRRSMAGEQELGSGIVIAEFVGE
jgi:hypothetical protein